MRKAKGECRLLRSDEGPFKALAERPRTKQADENTA